MYEKLRIQISNVKNIRNSNHYLGILYLRDYRGLNFRNKQRSNSEWNTVRLLNLIKEPVFFILMIDITQNSTRYLIFNAVLNIPRYIVRIVMAKIYGTVKIFWCSREFVITFAMTKVHCIRLLDTDISSVTVTKTYILLLAFCTSPQQVYWIIYLLFIYTLFIVDKQT